MDILKPEEEEKTEMDETDADTVIGDIIDEDSSLHSLVLGAWDAKAKELSQKKIAEIKKRVEEKYKQDEEFRKMVLEKTREEEKTSSQSKSASGSLLELKQTILTTGVSYNSTNAKVIAGLQTLFDEQLQKGRGKTMDHFSSKERQKKFVKLISQVDVNDVVGNGQKLKDDLEKLSNDLAPPKIESGSKQ